MSSSHYTHIRGSPHLSQPLLEGAEEAGRHPPLYSSKYMYHYDASIRGPHLSQPLPEGVKEAGSPPPPLFRSAWGGSSAESRTFRSLFRRALKKPARHTPLYSAQQERGSSTAARTSRSLFRRALKKPAALRRLELRGSRHEASMRASTSGICGKATARREEGVYRFKTERTTPRRADAN